MSVKLNVFTQHEADQIEVNVIGEKKYPLNFNPKEDAVEVLKLLYAVLPAETFDEFAKIIKVNNRELAVICEHVIFNE